MNRRWPWLALLFVLSGLTARLGAQPSSPPTTSLNVKLGAKLDLKRFGGQDMDFVVTAVDPLKVRLCTVDRTKMITRTSSGSVAVAGVDYAGVAASTYSQTVPTVTPYEVARTNGISIEGAFLQKLYLLYEDERLVIYYHDTAATGAGECRLRVVQKTRP